MERRRTAKDQDALRWNPWVTTRAAAFHRFAGYVLPAALGPRRREARRGPRNLATTSSSGGSRRAACRYLPYAPAAVRTSCTLFLHNYYEIV